MFSPQYLFETQRFFPSQSTEPVTITDESSQDFFSQVYILYLIIIIICFIIIILLLSFRATWTYPRQNQLIFVSELFSQWHCKNYLSQMQPYLMSLTQINLFIAKTCSKGVVVTIESYGKLEISYINVDNF
jgi:p-aminobenzoyl-glutamate transporter AbgT